MKHRNIFTSQNQTIIRLFEEAGQPEKVLCIPLDYAKKTHVALCCNGSGKILKKAFPVKNTTEGIEHLLDVASGICRKHRIAREHVFFGGEDCGTFAFNFIHGLRQHGFNVVGVNAADAKKMRENYQASTDSLDLLGIAGMLLNKRGNPVGNDLGAQRALRALTRHRRLQVKMQTAVGNRIHQIVDQLFPGFLDEKSSVVPAFSEASLHLMEERFSARQIAKRQDKVLLRQLQTHGLQKAEEALPRLKAFARQALGHPKELSGLLQTSLAGEVRLYRCLENNIEQVHREIARQLAKTPAAMLTTVRGIGITLAAGVSAEIGPPQSQPSLRKLGSYAGIVPRIKQTGGPEKAPVAGTVSRRCNHILKDYLVQCGGHLGLHGPADLMEDHRRRAANGQHADFGMARRFLRIAMKLMHTGMCYIPPELRNDIDGMPEYYLRLWPKILGKWTKAKAADTAFADENPLGKWRNTIQELYGIKLPLPK